MEAFGNSQPQIHEFHRNTEIDFGHGAGASYSAMAAITAEQLLSSKPRGDSTSDSAASRPVPLICSICPKNTNFSDVSHLLTHISSKGHLSNMFKLDIARYTDQGAREKLEEYQAWFDEFNIRELLQSRSENRIQKGSVGRSRNGSSTRGGTPTVGLRGGRTSLVSQSNSTRDAVTRGKRVSHVPCG
jgi:hypothetical protein